LLDCCNCAGDARVTDRQKTDQRQHQQTGVKR
jgi:hypothetical protein